MDLGCNTFQLFIRNPRSLIQSKPLDLNEVEIFKAKVCELDIRPIVVHANYLINMASQDTDKLKMSIESLAEEIERADKIGAEYVIVHPGHAKDVSKDEACSIIARSIDTVLEMSNTKSTICLENMSGMGSEVGSTFFELKEIINRSEFQHKIGICLDTCHAFAQGYDLRKNLGLDALLYDIDKEIGLSRLKVVHSNDCLFDCGLKKDRHTNLGRGKIGLDSFRKIVKRKEFSGLPFILETPDKEEGMQKRDVELLKSFLEDVK